MLAGISGDNIAYRVITYPYTYFNDLARELMPKNAFPAQAGYRMRSIDRNEYRACHILM